MEDLGTAKGSIELDFSKMSAGIATAVTQLEKIESTSKGTDTAMKSLQTSLTQSAQKTLELSSRLNAAKSKVKVYEKEISVLKTQITEGNTAQQALAKTIESAGKKYADAKTNMQQLATKYDDARKNLEELTNAQIKDNEAIEKAEQTVKIIGQEYEQAQKATKQYATELNSLESDQKQLDTEMADATLKLNEFEAGCASAKDDVNRLTTELQTSESTTKTFAQNFEEAGNKLEEIGSKMQTVGDNVSKVGDKLTKSVSVPLTGAATAALAVSGNFESSMSQVQATMGITKDATTELNGATVNTMDTLSDLAKQLGASTAWSAKDCADALNYLALAGYDTEEMVGTLPTVLNLASAGGYDLATASDQVTDAMSALGLGVNDAKTMVDQMAKTSSTTNTSVSQLGEGILTIGATAKGLKGGVTELNTALGILANNGLKGAEGGTHLRNILLSLQSPTDDAAATLETLGVKVYDAEGNMRSLNDVFGDLKSSISGMTQEGQDSVISTLFNTRDLAAARTLMESAGDQWTSLQTTISNSEGSASKMAETQLDNMKGQITILKSAVEGLGISFGELMLPDAKKAIAWAQDLIDSINNLDDGTKKLIVRIGAAAIATGPILKIGGKVIKGVGTITSGTGKIVKGIANVAKNAGTLTKATNGVASSAGTAVSALGKMGPAALGVAAGVTAVVALGVACHEAYKKAVDNNLAEHFGDVKLSAEEAADAAARICETNWTASLNLYTNAKGELDSIHKDIDATFTELNKTQWKISTGIELSDEEKSDYKSNIDAYISSVQSYVEQQHLTTTLAINTVYGDDSADGANVKAFSDSFYNGTYAELNALGTNLASIVNEAMANGTLNDAATQEAIRNAEEALHGQIDKLSQARYEVKLDNILLSAPKEGLSVESFKEIQKSISELMQSRQDEILQAREDILVPYRVKLADGKIDQATYEAEVKSATQNAADKMGAVQLQGVQYEIDTISGKYEGASNEAAKEFTKNLTTTFTDSLSMLNDGDINFNKFAEKINEQMNSAVRSFSSTDRSAIQELLKQMEPTREQLEQLQTECVNAGASVPESITEGLNQIYALEAMTGSSDAMWNLLAENMADSPAAQEALAEAAKSGRGIPTELATAMASKCPDVYNATVAVYDNITAGQVASAETLKESFRNLGYDLPDEMIKALSSKDANVQQQTITTLQNAKMGVDVTGLELKDAFANIGYDAPQSLIDSMFTMTPAVKSQVVGLLMQLPSASAEQRETILSTLQSLGVDCDNSLIAGMESIKSDVNAKGKEVGQAGVDGIKSTVDGADGGTVEIKTNDPISAAKSWLDSFVDWIKGKSATANIGGLGGLSMITPHATGGIVDSPEISLVGEDGAESIIPLTAKYRSEALELYSQTGKLLGVDEVTANGTDELVNRIVDALKSAKITPQVNVNMTDGDVLLNGEKVGRKLAPTISRLQAQK